MQRDLRTGAYHRPPGSGNDGALASKLGHSGAWRRQELP